MNNEIITPEAALAHGVILNNSYTVVDLARIAAGCAGDTHAERVVDALQLLAAAEDMANPDPWAFQYQATEDDRRAMDLEKLAAEIIASASNGGVIRRKDLCCAACEKLGKGESADTADRRFDEWLETASATRWRWAYFREAYAREQDAAPGKWAAVVDRAWESLSKVERRNHREEFRLNFEKGTGKAARIMHNEQAARRLLLGESPDFEGLMSHLTQASHKPAPPRTPREREQDGTFKRCS